MSYKTVKKLVPSSKYSIKCPYTMKPEGVCMHNTANEASATNEVAYMTRNDLKKSFHYAVDDTQVIQAIKEDRNAWHAGDGSNGKGNRKYIAIEICYSLAKKQSSKEVYAKFEEAEKNAAKLAASILKRYGWTTKQLKKHQDFSGKYCPHRTLDLGWDRFVKMVEKELNPVVEKPFKEGNIIYPIQDVVLLSTAGYSGKIELKIKKGTKCKVMKYHDKNGLYMALGDENGVYYSSAWTKEFNKFSLENPYMDEILELQKQLKEKDSIIDDLAGQVAQLIEDDKENTLNFEEYKKDLEARIEKLEDDLEIKSNSLTATVKAYNELKSSRFMGIVRLLEKLFPKKE